MKKEIRLHLPVLVRLCALLLCAVFCCGDRAGAESEKTVKIKIGHLQQDIKGQLDKIQKKDVAEGEILNELDRINRKLSQQKEKTSVVKKRLAEQQQLLPVLKEKVRLAEEKRDSLRRHMLKRLRSFYMMGKLGLLNVTFSNKNLPELMLFEDSFQHLIAYDKKIIRQYRVALHELDQVVTAHELEKSLLEELLQQTEEEEQELLVLRRRQEYLLNRVRQEKSVYQQAVDEMRRAEKELINTLVRLRVDEQLHNKQGLLLGKGHLASPVTGTVLHRFGDIVQTGLRRGESLNGITVDIDPDTPVYAVYKGEVAYADYKRGYGNTVIIDHGGNYFTVTARLDEIFVHAGDKVKQDQKIGTSGDIATLYEPGLYFEIRHGTTPLDPLEWLDID
ncbi:MAG: murein hydrolase activator EnvC family protein [Candidatus Electrothrix sp. YB6]